MKLIMWSHHSFTYFPIVSKENNWKPLLECKDTGIINICSLARKPAHYKMCIAHKMLNVYIGVMHKFCSVQRTCPSRFIAILKLSNFFFFFFSGLNSKSQKKNSILQNISLGLFLVIFFNYYFSDSSTVNLSILKIMVIITIV